MQISTEYDIVYVGENTRSLLSVSGDAIVYGTLRTSEIRYREPRTNYHSISGDLFVPWSNLDYQSSLGNGGTYIEIGPGALSAPVNLPHGATVTDFRVSYYDNSPNSISISLVRMSLHGGGYSTLAQKNSYNVKDGSGYGSSTDSTIDYAVIDNQNFAYTVRVYCNWWDEELKIMGALITYTIDEAP
jgi:hypothetical protein